MQIILFLSRRDREGGEGKIKKAGAFWPNSLCVYFITGFSCRCLRIKGHGPIKRAQCDLANFRLLSVIELR